MRLPHRWNTKHSLFDKDLVFPTLYDNSPVDSPSVLDKSLCTLYLCIAGELSALAVKLSLTKIWRVPELAFSLLRR